jgi:transcription initiation factor TFIIE subunit alpha
MAIDLVKICERKRKRVTDEELSKKLNQKVTEIRTILNRLHYRGIACYQKTKNTKTGWYSYTWEIKTKRIAEIIIEEQSEKLLKLNEKKEVEEEYNMFNCLGCGERAPFEIAAEYQFICPNCGKNMEAANTEDSLKKLNQRVGLISEELKQMQKILEK